MIILKIFDGRYNDLDKKLSHEYGDQGSHDFALNGNSHSISNSKIAITSKLFSITYE